MKFIPLATCVSMQTRAIPLDSPLRRARSLPPRACCGHVSHKPWHMWHSHIRVVLRGGLGYLACRWTRARTSRGRLAMAGALPAACHTPPKAMGVPVGWLLDTSSTTTWRLSNDSCMPRGSMSKHEETSKRDLALLLHRPSQHGSAHTRAL